MEDFVTAPGQTVLAPNELLVAFQIPAPQGQARRLLPTFYPSERDGYRCRGAWGACVALDGDTCTAARIGLGAVAARPLLAKEAGDALVGKTLDDAAIEAAAQLAQQAALTH